MSKQKMALPRYVGLKSKYNNKYLRYIREDVEIHGFLQFSGEEVITPYSKYQVERANIGKGLVHIRCCYNNKFWVRCSNGEGLIVAGADEPNEDQSSCSCTLFEPEYVDGQAQTFRLRHVQLGHYALLRTHPSYGSCLIAQSMCADEYHLYDVFIVIDWESLLTLPKHIAFKGDNGYYLSARNIHEHYNQENPYLEFASSDIGDPTVGNKVFTNQDGSVRIKSDYFDKFWRRNPDWLWIWPDSDGLTNHSDTLFWPVRIEKNVFALRNFGNNNFCASVTKEGKTNCLCAAVSTISQEAHLEVVELVITRNIYNVDFHLKDARIYNKSIITITTTEVINNTQEKQTQQVKLSYVKTKSSTWKSSISLKLGLKINMESSIPVIFDGKIEISGELSGAYEWGETITKTTTLETVHTVIVPPRTRVTVRMIATQSSCDVPYSYSQSDTLTDGTNVVVDMDDGVFTGINCYNFKYEINEEKL